MTKKGPIKKERKKENPTGLPAGVGGLKARGVVQNLLRFRLRGSKGGVGSLGCPPRELRCIGCGGFQPSAFHNHGMQRVEKLFVNFAEKEGQAVACHPQCPKVVDCGFGYGATGTKH